MGCEKEERMKSRGEFIVLLWIIVMVMCLCGACGSDTEDLEITIRDGQVETIISVSSGDTVEAILKKAEISLNENDAIIPSLKDVVISGETEIVIGRCADVTVCEDDKTFSLTMTGMKVQDALDEVGIQLGAYDLINHDLDAYLVNGMNISVERRHSVTVSDNGRGSLIITSASTVEELLAEQDISLDDEDRISPSLGTQLSDGTNVVIQRVASKYVTEEEEIEYDTVYESSSTLYEGETSVKQNGENGIKEITYLFVYVDGEEESREVISEEIIKEPVDEIILRGTKKKSASSSGPSSKDSSSGKSVVSREKFDDCDGSGHGYYKITYSDGSVEYVDY